MIYWLAPSDWNGNEAAPLWFISRLWIFSWSNLTIWICIGLTLQCLVKEKKKSERKGKGSSVKKNQCFAFNSRRHSLIHRFDSPRLASHRKDSISIPHEYSWPFLLHNNSNRFLWSTSICWSSSECTLLYVCILRWKSQDISLANHFSETHTHAICAYVCVRESFLFSCYMSIKNRTVNISLSICFCLRITWI